MLTIHLTEVQSNNLKIFLSRVDLKGSEVAAFAEILQQVNLADKAEGFPKLREEIKEVGGVNES